jgi:hypothetical protein
MKMICLAVVAFAFSGILSLSYADADPKLQALIEGTVVRDDVDSRRSAELDATRQEQNRLESSVGGLSPEAVEATKAFNEAQASFQAAAAELQQQVQELAAAPDLVGANDLKQLDEASERLRDLGGEVDARAGEIVDAGGADDFKLTLKTSNFLSETRVLIGQEAAIALARFSLENNGELSESDVRVLGSIAERLEDFGNAIAEVAKDAEEINGPIADLEEIASLEALRATEADRNREAQDIEDRQQFAAEGGDVLAALGGRLNGDADGAELKDDQQAGDRVRELAEGLAGAGQRLEEIRQEENELPAIGDDTDLDIIDIDKRRKQVDLQLADRETQKAVQAKLEDDLERVDALIAQERQNGDPEAADGLKGFRDNLEDTLVRLSDRLEGNKPLSDEERAALIEERKQLQARRDLLAERLVEAGRKQRQLNAEAARIAALQGELADLIRRGAPLGGPQDTSTNSAELDGFLQGGGDSDGLSEQSSDDSDGVREVLEALSRSDPLGLDQFGLDADQGATETILGGVDGGGGGVALIPCPPGSNLLPVGTPVSDTALCFI